MRAAVNADMDRREVDPSRVGPHKRKGHGTVVNADVRIKSSVEMDKQEARAQTGRAMP